MHTIKSNKLNCLAFERKIMTMGVGLVARIAVFIWVVECGLYFVNYCSCFFGKHKKSNLKVHRSLILSLVDATHKVAASISRERSTKTPLETSVRDMPALFVARITE